MPLLLTAVPLGEYPAAAEAGVPFTKPLLPTAVPLLLPAAAPLRPARTRLLLPPVMLETMRPRSKGKRPPPLPLLLAASSASWPPALPLPPGDSHSSLDASPPARRQLPPPQLHDSMAIPFSASLFITSVRICTSIGKSRLPPPLRRAPGASDPLCCAADTSSPVGTT